MKRPTSILLLLFVLALLLPVGSAKAEIRKGAFTLSPMAGVIDFDSDDIYDDTELYGLGLGYNFSRHWGGELMLNYANAEIEGISGHVNVYIGHADLLYHFTPKKTATIYLALGGGGVVYDGMGKISTDDEDEDFLLNYGIGLKAAIGDTTGLRLDARHLYAIENDDAYGKEMNHFTYTGGLFFQFGGKKAPSRTADADNDGVSDALDQCPDTRAGATVDATGCAIDSDNDGVADYLDQCEGTPAGTPVNRDGCPKDKDGDGVPNYRDLCPDTPEGTVVTSRGCAKKLAPDADKDGVADTLDRCPNTPADVPVTDRGCPKDSDDDTVFDFEDKCPDTPAGDLVDASGCTAGLTEPVTETLDITFDRARAAIKPGQEQELEKARALLGQYPNASIIVEGHTDSTGSESLNMELSQQRAESVRRYLIEEMGVSAKRIRAKGFGESRPVADNATPEGRLANRRVQITIEQ